MTTKDVKKRIKEYFLLNPTIRLRIRHIERKTKTALPSVIRYTKELNKEGILKTQKVSGVIFYSADRASKDYLLEKKLFNIRQLFDSGLVDYIIREYSNPPIILFGSYSKGEDIEDSDIDIYIESPKKQDISFEIFEKKLRRNIQIFKHRNIKGIRNMKLANNIINGIVLNGFLEVFK